MCIGVGMRSESEQTDTSQHGWHDDRLANTILFPRVYKGRLWAIGETCTPLPFVSSHILRYNNKYTKEKNASKKKGAPCMAFSGHVN